MKPIVSVIVPTKNRYKYLKKLIALVDSFGDEEIELVVQDNSDDNTEIRDYLNNSTFNSLRYFYCSDSLSMSQNADMAVKNSTGEYVCFIGDDDAVCRNIVDCARWMKTEGVDALRSLYLNYAWGEKTDGSINGTLYYESKLGFHYQVLDPKKELVKVLKEGVPDFREMPKFYHGIISRKVIEKLFATGGTCFPGVTPDMSSAVSICFLVEKYVYINIPVVIPGMSKMVGGGVMGKVLSLEEVNFITENDRNNWEPGFPKLWATELIWPDCAIKALAYVNHLEYMMYFNKNRMLSRLVAVHRDYFKDAYHYADGKISFIYELIRYYFVEGTSYLWRKKILSKTTGLMDGKYFKKKGFKDILQVESYLMNLLNKNTVFDIKEI